MKRPPERGIDELLEKTTDFAFKIMRNGKHRRAANLARRTLQQLPPNKRKSPDALMLRLISVSARYMADFFAAVQRERRAKRKRRRRPKAKSRSLEPISQLLLVPEAPAARKGKP